MPAQRGLGRGLDNLIPTEVAPEPEFDVTAPVDSAGERTVDGGMTELSVDLIDPSPHQPRQHFDEQQLRELAASIMIHGVLQPVVVTAKDGRYELIAGERRVRASRLAGRTTIPAIIRSFDEQEKLELALIENIQRAELNPIEMATAYRKLIDQFNLTYEQLSARLGKAVSTMANTVRLLGLPLEAKRAVAEGRLSEGHSRVLLTFEEEAPMLELMELIMKHGWTVRHAEEYARGLRGKEGSHAKAKARIAQQSTLTKSLGSYLGTKVTQQLTAKGGKLIIEYYSEEELDRIYQQIKGEHA